MDIVAQEKKNNKRYLPHTVSTKEGAVKLYRQTKDIDFVLRRYHISKASLMRWNRLYDGTKESLFEREGAASAFDSPGVLDRGSILLPLAFHDLGRVREKTERVQ